MTPAHFRSSGTTVFLLGSLLSVALGGCGRERTPEEEFRDLEVAVEALDGRIVRLDGGRAALADEGIEVVLDQLLLTGSLDGTPGEVTVGFLYTNSEGALSELELVVALREEERMRHLDSYDLGGPFRVEGIRYEGGEIVTYLLDFAIDDPPCCPTISLQRRFQIVEGEVREVEIFDLQQVDPTQAELETPI